MIRWTTAGAVSHPTTVQIRVQRSYPGRIRAGAPVPTRSMSPEEVQKNILFFTEGMRSPRTKPCETLVLSGVGVAQREDTPAAIGLAKQQQIERVVLHAGVEDLATFNPSAFTNLVDLLVVPVQPASGALVHAGLAIKAAMKAGIEVATNTVLSSNALPAVMAAARVLASARPKAVTFTYPFPISGGATTDIPTPARAMLALQPAIQVLDSAGVESIIKGLPACFLGAHAHRIRRTQNRWYVDADHQHDAALMFFPDVVSFHKDEVCRFCGQNQECDGFFATYLRRPGFPQLKPFDPPVI